MGGRWWQREPVQPKFEDCIKILGRKNLVFFKVLDEVRGGERDRNIKRHGEGGKSEREKGRRGGKVRGREGRAAQEML